MDLEDIGSYVGAAKKVLTTFFVLFRRIWDIFRSLQAKASSLSEPKEMLTTDLRQVLSKQGYRLIGSHSGVKLCRWTKV